MAGPLVRFSELRRQYRVLFFDASGVLKTAERLLDGVPAMLAALREEKRPAYLLSNDASKSVAGIAAKYQHPDLGVLIPERRVITSGLIASRHLGRHHARQRVAWLGPETCTPYIEEAGCIPVNFSQIQSADEFDVFALMDNSGYDWRRELNRFVNFLREKPGIPLYAPNPDLVYPIPGGGVNLASGALVKMVEAVIERPFLFFGKPGREMFDFALDRAREEMPGLRPEECLMVGDTLTTDIQGAQAAGIHSLLVLTGNTTRESYSGEITRTGICPRHVALSVVDP